jgi:hypothetical protein
VQNNEEGRGMNTVNKDLFDHIYFTLEALYVAKDGESDNDESYDESYIKAQDNLEKNEADTLEYLGTYFPRSFMEALGYLPTYSVFGLPMAINSEKK